MDKQRNEMLHTAWSQKYASKRYEELKVTEICTFFDLQSNATLMYRGADKSLAWPGRKQVNVTVRMAGISFGTLPCRGEKTWRQLVSMLLKSHASLTCFWARFPPGRDKDLSAPRYKTFRQTPVKSAHIKQLLHITKSYGYIHREKIFIHTHIVWKLYHLCLVLQSSV